MPKYKQYSPILASNFEQKDHKTPGTIHVSKYKLIIHYTNKLCIEIDLGKRFHAIFHKQKVGKKCSLIHHCVEYSMCCTLVKTRSLYYFSIKSYGVLKTVKTSNLKAHNNEKMAVKEKEPYLTII